MPHREMFSLASFHYLMSQSRVGFRGQNSKLQMRGQLLRFYVQQINLLSAICYDRNYKAIAHIEQIMPFEVIVTVLADDKM